MDKIEIVRLFGYIGASLLLFQGISIQYKSRSNRRSTAFTFGSMTSLLALAGAVLVALLFSGRMIMSPEFDLILVQGSLAAWAMRALLFGLPVVASLGWHSARQAAQNSQDNGEKVWPDRRNILIVIGLVVGFIAAAQLRALNSEGFESDFIIYAHNLLSPLLMIWFLLSISEMVLTILQVSQLSIRLLGSVSMIIIVSLIALVKSPVWDSQDLWPTVVWIIALTILAPIFLWYASDLSGKLFGFSSQRFWQWFRVLALITLPTIIQFYFSYQVLLERDLLMVNKLIVVFPTLVMVAIFAMIIGFAWFKQASQNQFFLRRFTRGQLGLVAILLASMGGIFLLLFVPGAPRLEIILLLLLIWVFFADRILGAPMVNKLMTFIPDDLPSKVTWTNFGKSIKTMLSWGQAIYNRLTIIFNLQSTGVAIVKILLVILIVSAVGEISSRGKTIIEQFEAPNLSEKDGRRVSDRVFFNLGLLNQQLQPKLVVLDFFTSQEEGVGTLGVNSGVRSQERVSFIDPGRSSGRSDEILQASAPLKIAGIEIPLSQISGPIQRLMRNLLGVTVIQASIQTDGNDLILMATSNIDSFWKIRSSDRVTGSQNCTTNSSREEEEEEKEGKEDPKVKLMRQLDDLADQLAFNIVLSLGKDLSATGMTNLWEAFQAYQKGLDEIENFENGKQDASIAAIIWFEEAICLDQRFALAHYQLGLALQANKLFEEKNKAAEQNEEDTNTLESNNETETAEIIQEDKDAEELIQKIKASFNKSLEVTPDFSPARNALAVLDFQEGFYGDARSKWHEILRSSLQNGQLIDQFFASNGLCLVANAQPISGKAPLVYYSCQRALQLYELLPLSHRSDPRIKNVRGVIEKQLKEAIPQKQLFFNINEQRRLLNELLSPLIVNIVGWTAQVPLVTPSFTPTPIATATPQLLLAETFSDGQANPNGWDLYNFDDIIKAQISEGGLRLSSSNIDSIAWSIMREIGNQLVDVRIDVKASRLSNSSIDNAFGIVCRYQDENNFYFFNISSDGYYQIVKSKNGDFINLISWTNNGLINLDDNSKYQLRAECIGDTLSFFVNDERLDSVHDSEWAFGGVGLIIGALAEPGTDIFFSDFIVSLISQEDIDDQQTEQTPGPIEALQAYYTILQSAINDETFYREAWDLLSSEFQNRNFNGDLAEYERQWLDISVISIVVTDLNEGPGKSEVFATLVTVHTDGTVSELTLRYCMVFEQSLWKIDWVNISVPCDVN